MPFNLKRFSSREPHRITKQPTETTIEVPDSGSEVTGSGVAASDVVSPPPEVSLPSYATTGPSIPTISLTVPDATALFRYSSISDEPLKLPDCYTTLAHLRLLEAFFCLKSEVAYTDGLFNLWDCRAPGTDESFQNDPASFAARTKVLSNIREKRWSIYVARAVDRFEMWWAHVLCNRNNECQMLQRSKMTKDNFESFLKSGVVHKWTTAMLPPLDVLMVWHTFMLNPRNYLEDCLRYGLKDTWATGMPWKTVNSAIDETFNYDVPEAAKVDFERCTGWKWDNADDLLDKTVMCPLCPNRLVVPWTTCGLPEYNTVPWRFDDLGRGYGEKGFSYKCNRCMTAITFGTLRLGKFKRDIDNLLLHDWPMGGTILFGTSGVIKEPKDGNYPNTLITGTDLKSQILEFFTPGNSSITDMDNIRTLIEDHMTSTGTAKTMKGPERLAVRQMMSRYWDNHGYFSMELAGAVIRQGAFVDKMHKINWLHSPAAITTMDRLLQKYARFFELLARNPKRTIVPTLDVDLAWHTAQLSPSCYYNYSLAATRDRFVDHDDKIDEEKLPEGFEWTSKAYEKTYGSVYSECTCWYCEAIRARHVSSVSKVLGGSRHDKIYDHFYESGAAKFCPPDRSAHISSHNAVPSQPDPVQREIADRLRLSRLRQLDGAYEKACRRALKKGKPVPQKQKFYEDRHGYNYDAGFYPYCAMYYSPFMYPYGLYMMPYGVGMYGACVAGTCGGRVAAGSCSSSGGCGGCNSGGNGGDGGGGDGGDGGGCGGCGGCG